VDVPEVHYARNGSIALAYQVLGDAPIDVVFQPGFIGNLDLMWEYPPFARFLRRLASFSRLIVTDRRGSGLSDRLSPEDLPPLEVLMDDLLVVLDEVGSDRASLFGFSDAGSLCAVFAATYPERTNALALFDAAVAGAVKDDFPWTWSEEEWSTYLGELEAGWGTLAYAEKVVPWWYPSLAGDERAVRWWARYMRQAASPNSAAAIERLWHQVDVRPVLPTIRVPTLVLHRVDDVIEYVDAGRDLARRIPGARLVELPGGDHAPWAGDQDQVLDEIEEFFTGVRRGSSADRVLATVLFTDIVGSTERAAALGDASWNDLLEEHHDVVRRQLAAFRGEEVDTAGDGFLATFDGPARAVECGRAIASSVRELGMEVRAGVHTGEIERGRDAVRGIAVHIGARVMSLASASEVLVSQTVKDLVAGSGLAFEDAGEHELKGIPNSTPDARGWRLWRVIG
jgi:pimeloyl-ACP methyl ester carboxylesterase